MPTCPLCGAEIGEGEGFCPKCLRRLMAGKAPESPKRKNRKKLAGIIIACVVAIAVVTIVITHLPRVPSGSVAELESVALSAHDFAEMLFARNLTDLQRGDLWQDYQGKQVQWTNQLRHLSPEGEGFIAYFLNPLDWARTEVQAVFDESQTLSLEELEEGDMVTYSGVLDSFTTDEIRLAGCTVVSLPVVPLWWSDDIDTHGKRILLGDGVLYLAPGTYDDATEYLPRPAPKITAINATTGELLWEAEETEAVLVGIDSHYTYAWHSVRVVAMSEPDEPWYWYASDITALDRVSGQIGWSSHLSEGVRCLQSDDCLPDEWSESDFVNCCILGRSVKEEIANKAAPGLIFLMDKLPLSELTYEYEGVIYQSACAVYGGMGPECDALQAVDRQTGGVLWMMTFQGKGMNDFSIANGILYVFTDEGVGAFEL
jgi:predicted nucleic acid-binding Zn ribbon protein